MTQNVNFLLPVGESIRHYLLQYDISPSRTAFVAEKVVEDKVRNLQEMADRLLKTISEGAPTLEKCREILALNAAFIAEEQKVTKLGKPEFGFWLLEILYTFLYGQTRSRQFARFEWSVKKNTQLVNEQIDSYLMRCRTAIETIFSSGRVTEAAAAFHSFCQIVPDGKKSPFLLRLGDCYMNFGFYEKAFTCYQSTHRENNSEPEEAIKRAKCLMKLGRPDEAEECVKSLFSRAHAPPSPYRNRGWKKIIQAQLQQRHFVQAIASCLQAMKEFPQENHFRLQLINAHLCCEEAENIFSEHLRYLHSYFAEQDCYMQLARTEKEAFCIFFDFLEYTAKRSVKARNQFIDILSRNSHRAELGPLLRHLFSIKMGILANALTLLTEKIEETMQSIGSTLLSTQETAAEFQMQIGRLAREVNGGSPKSMIPIGMLDYLRAVGEVMKRYQEYYENEARHQTMAQSFRELESTLHKLQADVVEKRKAITALYGELQRKTRKEQPFMEEEEEVSALEWMKRGKLMNYIRDNLVPYEQRENLRHFLSSCGIDLDILFMSDLLDHVDDPAGYFQGKQIDSPDKLRSYIQEPRHKRTTSRA